MNCLIFHGYRAVAPEGNPSVRLLILLLSAAIPVLPSPAHATSCIRGAKPCGERCIARSETCFPSRVIPRIPGDAAQPATGPDAKPDPIPPAAATPLETNGQGRPAEANPADQAVPASR